MEHHEAVHRAHRKRRRRKVVDLVVILLFLAAILGILWGNIARRRSMIEIEKRETSAEVMPTIASEREADTIKNASARSAAADPTTETIQAPDETATSSSAPDLSVDEFSGPVNGLATSTPPGSVAEPDLGTITPPPQFSDVTSRQYKNDRLGFIMEYPDDWFLIYENNGEVAFANHEPQYGEAGSDIPDRANASWVRIGRPCQSADATSTPFVAGGGSSTPTLERYVCVPPLAITMGIRADAPFVYQRERFLLDVVRTIYPIVSGAAPYIPTR